MMAPTSSGPRARPLGSSKKKSGTVSTNRHRFEPFSQRIARLKINPIHRTQPSDLDASREETTSSSFRSSFEKWRGLNLSENFRTFASRAAPLCETLVQIVYNEDRLMGLLAEHIDKRDAVSMEPLLDLLTNFVQDLGQRFEKHFSRAIALVASVAGSHQDVEVIEWSFAGLAYMFKSLSRLLAPDLRPTLEIMVPYLGKERQKHFIVRFAAESMSFLIRKAGAKYKKDKEPLRRAICFLFQASQDVGQNWSYQEGLMTLFSDVISGIQSGLHSSGLDVAQCLLETVTEIDQTSFPQEVIVGTLTNIVHNTNADTFAPLLDVIIEHARSISSRGESGGIKFGTRLLFLVIATRKGTRIRQWAKVNETLLHLCNVSISSRADQDVSELLATAAVTLQTCPIDQLLPFMRPLMDAVSNEKHSEHFLGFCRLWSRIESDRFGNIVLPYLQKFVISHWADAEDVLSTAIRQLPYQLNSTSNGSDRINIPLAWQEHIIEHFYQDPPSDENLARLCIYAEMFEIALVATDSVHQLCHRLHELVALYLQPGSSTEDSLCRFSVGFGLRAYVRLARRATLLDTDLWPQVYAAGPRFARLQAFLEGVLDYAQVCPPLSSQSSISQPLVSSLIDNLSTPSHHVRLLSLRILHLLSTRLDSQDATPITTAIEIESLSLTFENARLNSLNVRRLTTCYDEISPHSPYDRLIPTYCLGLLSVKSAQVWQDACEALKDICKQTRGEQIVADIVLPWLQHSPDPKIGELSIESTQRTGRATEFECANVQMLHGVIKDCFEGIQTARNNRLAVYQTEITFCDQMPKAARCQALRVLNTVPHMAEKRSRQFVPLFLSWASQDDETVGNLEMSTKSSITVIADEPSYQWNLADRKTLLGVFGQFQNPKVLYKASEVYETLLDCLANGDNDIQRAAMTALFTWKKPNILPYETNLTNLLDDSRFNDELARFNQAGSEDIVQADHRKDMMPLILRLLYGKMVSRKGGQSNQVGQDAKRKTILRSLDRFKDEDLASYIHIAFGSLSDLHLIAEGKVMEQCLAHEFLGLRKQYGLLKMVEAMLETLGSRLLPFTEQFMNAILFCLIRASRGLAKQPSHPSVHDKFQSAMTRDIRQIGIQCLDLLFARFREFDYHLYVPLIFTEIVNPRMEKFAIETSQGISGLLRLFGTWADVSRTALYLADFNKSLIKEIANCLAVKSAQEDVKMFVLDQIIQRMITSAVQDEAEPIHNQIRQDIITRVLSPNVEHILALLGPLLKGSSSRNLTESAVQVLAGISSFASSSVEIESLISTILIVLKQPSERVSPKSKGGLMRTLAHLIPHILEHTETSLLLEIYLVISSSFNYFRDRTNRETLSTILSILASTDAELSEVAGLCADLNSFSGQHLDYVDFTKRLAAFTKLNETAWEGFTAKQWRPLLFNMLYHVRDEEEMAIRSSASFGLRRFIDRVQLSDEDQATDYQDLVNATLLPALQNGMKQKAELVRMEIVSVLGYFVKSFPNSPALGDLLPLLVNDDEEASFFSNILHIQQHRRLRALRRLANETSNGRIKCRNVNDIFLPLIEHFVFEAAEGDEAHNLISETMSAIGVLAEWLEWRQFRALFRRYRGYMEARPSIEKTMIKLLGHVTDALCRAAETREGRVRSDDDKMDTVESVSRLVSTLSRSLPTADALASELSTVFLPFLTGFIHNKEESEISLRIPVAVTTVKLLKLLPQDQISQFLPPVLLDVSSILRSKSQESRDIARKTLADITLLLGPSYFGFVLKELRSALPRGAQLHILSFTVHSLLVVTADSFMYGDIDYCLSGIVSTVVEDVFGLIGQEKDADGYTSKMREVKSNKSYDSMELLAKHTTISHLHEILLPLRTILRERLNSKLVKKADELLRRTGVGILRNHNANSKELLVFCYELMKENYGSPRSLPIPAKKAEPGGGRFLVQVSSASKNLNRASTTSYSFKLTKFALDVLRSVLHKYNELLTAENVSGFLPMIGDAIVQSQEEVKVSALRLISTVLKIPFTALDKNAPTYIAEAIKMVKNAPDTNHESAQAALKVVTAILRERKSVEIRDADLSYLLQRLKADLEEPDRQGITFNFVKAVIARKIVLAEVYDLMDTVASMMVTNHNRDARDLARGVYFQFLMHYPQGKNRWSKQLSFLVKNMSYAHQEGRKSVLEAVHLLLSKVGDDLVQEVVGAMFVPVLMVVANDDSAECREMGATLLSEVFSRADREHVQSFLTLLRNWIESADNPSLIVIALQAYRIYFDTKGSNGDNEVPYLQNQVYSIVKSEAKDSSCGHWESIYFATLLFTKLCKLFPELTMCASSAPMWSLVRGCLTYPHAWVKGNAANLLGVYFADLARANAAVGYGALPLTSPAALPLGAESMLEVTKASLRVMRTPNVSEELATQSARNLVFLGRCLAANGLQMETCNLNDNAEEMSDGAEDQESDQENGSQGRSQKLLLQYLFERLSSILRKEPLTTRASSLIPKTAALQLIASLCRHIGEADLKQFLPSILLPLQILTDPSIPAPRSTDEEFQIAQKALVTNSQEIMDLLQKQFGTTEYVSQMSKVKEGIRQRREGRRIKRRIEVVADPERAGRDKKRKNERKKERRKEIGADERSRRRGW